MEPLYPIRTAAKLTSLSLDTLRAWERRYSAVIPERTDRGRLYSKAHIEKLILLRTLVEQGHGIGRIAHLNAADLKDLLTSARPVASEAQPVNAQIHQLADWFAAFDDARACQELSRLAILTPTRELVLNTLLPLMREVGERWDRGQMGVAQEHLVSAAMRNILGSLLRIQTSASSAPRMLISALAGDLHEFGILAAAMIAVTAGWNPVYLGPNLPAVEIASAARQTGSKVVVIGNSGRRELGPAIQHLAGLLPTDVEIWLGGAEMENASSDAPASIVLIPDMETFENLCRDRI